MIFSVDIGKSGGIAYGSEAIDMPTKELTLKPALYQFALKDGKKQLIKSGPNAGQYKQKVRTPAKTATELDVAAIYGLFVSDFHDGPNTVVFELPGNSRGNSARSTATTFLNYGKLLAIAELADCTIVTVPANKWKKDLVVTKDKDQCVTLAETLSGLSFRTPRGALKDGPAEAWLIGHWYKTKENK